MGFANVLFVGWSWHETQRFASKKSLADLPTKLIST
ncbi:unnamed protein product, partial [marine sediment metagenome]